ncbi:T-cell differentiation antigen CD6 [Petaurus breviceps papuanus]|uniref:T-cell differentiation antigen CD6 n=1 Tax=Petaurus breviceps papuanus TaxID=3040969 RepID=UPI0036D9B90D
MRNWTSDIGKKPVRLVDRTGLCSGTVQVKISGSWQPICEDFWSNRASLTICRELDCMEPMASASTAVPERPEHLPVGNRSVVLNDTWGSLLPVLCDQGDWESCQAQSPACTSGRATKINCTGLWPSVLFTGVPSTPLYPSFIPPPPSVKGIDSRYGIAAAAAAITVQSSLSSSGNGQEALPGSLSFNMSLIPKTSSQPQLPTTASLVPIGMQKKGFPEQLLLFLCIVLAVLLLGSLTALAFIFLKAKGKYALPTTENHNQRTSTATLGGNNSYQEVSITIPKEEAPKLSLQVGALPSKDSDSDSDSDYERYDFHTQPPVPLSTFYNSQKHRVTEDMVQQSRFRMPPLQEDPPAPAPQSYLRHDSESSTSSGEGYCNSPTSRLPWSSHLLVQPPNLELAGSRATLPDARLLASQNHLRHNSESSTSSGEDYCNSPRSKPPLFIFQGSSSERNILEAPPNLELAGSQATILGSHSRIVSAAPVAEDDSSTSSGECYENSGSSQAPPMASFVCPEPCTPAVTGGHEDDSSDEDYDDIGAS